MNEENSGSIDVDFDDLLEPDIDVNENEPKKSDVIENLSLKNILPDPLSNEYNVKTFTFDPHDIKIQADFTPKSQIIKEKMVENRLAISYFGVFIGLFIFFFISIANLTQYSLSLILTLYAFDTVLLLKSFVIYFQRTEIYDEGKPNYLFIIRQLVPVIFIFFLLTGLIFIDGDNSLLITADFAMQHSYLIAFPFLLIATILLSLFHILMEYYSITIQDITERIRIDMFNNPDKLNRYRIMQHMSYTFLSMFICFLIFTIAEIPVILQIVYLLPILLIVNYAYYSQFQRIIIIKFSKRKQKITERQKEFEELNLFERLKERKQKEIPLSECIQREDIIIVSMIIAGILIYTFNIFGLQSFMSIIFLTIIQNLFLLFLGILVLMLFVIIPVATILFLLIVKISDYLYEKKIKSVLHILLVYLTSIMFIQIFIFNLQFIEIDAIYQSLIAYIGPALLLISKKLTKKGIKKIVK